jgi:hypothetical protein
MWHISTNEGIQMITNDTIIKAAKSAGLGVREDFGVVRETSAMHAGELLEDCRIFNPVASDFDNAMIRRGAEIVVSYWTGHKPVVHAHCGAFGVYINTPINNGDKGQAEREAVILCAAAKWDAMQGEQK